MGRASHWKIVFNILVRLGNLTWLLFTWLATIILTFLILEYFLNMKIIRMRTHMSKEDELQFLEAKGKVDNTTSNETPPPLSAHSIFAPPLQAEA